jgi:hypothetical protein
MYYDQLVSDKEAMKKINLDVRKQSQILGMLFAEHDILTTEQASMIKQQMSRPTYKCSTPGTLWEFYNFVTIALQQSHPKTWMEDQRVLHWFISDTFKFDKVNATAAATSDEEETSEENEVNEATVDNKATVDTIPENSEEETKDPAQVDLEDMIAEVEAEEETVESTIEEQRAEYWDQQTRVEEGLDHKGGGDDDDDEPVDDSPEITGIPDGDKLSDTDDEVTDAEAAELIKGQEAIDQQMAQEAAADNSVSDENIDDTLKSEPDFDLDFAPVADEETDVDSGDVDFDFA